jgi:serine/threonine protein phosphatase PrpC
VIDSGAERVVTTSMLVTARTHVGMRREENQDRALVVIGGTRESLDPVDHDGVLELRPVPTEGSVLLVADGMGGRSGGSTAAKIASDVVRRTFERRDVGGASPKLFVKTLNEALLKANRDVLWEAQGEASLTDMGTTATLVGVLGDRVHVAQVGDSRAYLIRGGAIVRLTRDQSLMSSSDTNASGIAVATRVLGTTAGMQTASASVGGLAGSPVAFTATATADAAEQMAAVPGGDGQSATVGTAVSTAPAVLVEDQYGNPVAGELVTFAVPFGDGTVDPGTAVPTNASGIATVGSWTLGTLAGPDSLTATAGSGGVTGSPVIFTATATAGAPALISRVASTNNQTAVTGSMVPLQPTVNVTDVYGNATSATVLFSANNGGSVGNSSVVTSAGSASTSWTVVVGTASLQNNGTFPNELTAEVSGAGISTTFDASAIYSYTDHVDPIWAGCVGCHGVGGSGGLDLSSTSPSTTWANLINNDATCDLGALGANVRRVSTAGGTIAANSYSVLFGYVSGVPYGSGCNSNNTLQSAANQAIIRAWIQNGGPNN